MFFWNSLAFSMIQQMLAIWSLVPLPFLKPAWTSGSSQFTYCWSLTWRILSITLLAWEMSAFFGISFLWDWNENWPFSVPWPLLSFPNLKGSCHLKKSTLRFVGVVIRPTRASDMIGLNSLQAVTESFPSDKSPFLTPTALHSLMHERWTPWGEQGATKDTPHSVLSLCLVFRHETRITLGSSRSSVGVILAVVWAQFGKEFPDTDYFRKKWVY